MLDVNPDRREHRHREQSLRSGVAQVEMNLRPGLECGLAVFALLEIDIDGRDIQVARKNLSKSAAKATPPPTVQRSVEALHRVQFFRAQRTLRRDGIIPRLDTPDMNLPVHRVAVSSRPGQRLSAGPGRRKG